MNCDAAFLDEITGAVREELAPHRAQGLPLKTAWHHVARRLGLTPRRVRAFFHGEVKPDDVRAHELARVREARSRRRGAGLAYEAAVYEDEIAELRARLDALEAAYRTGSAVEARSPA